MQTASIFSHLLKVGDEVIMHVTVEKGGEDIRNFQFWKHYPVNGTRGTIVSFERRTLYITHGSHDLYLAPPGVYTFDNIPIVKWEGEEYAILTAASYIGLVDQDEWAARVSAHRKSMEGKYYSATRKLETKALVRVGDLPASVAIKGDKITVAPMDNCTHGIVRAVEYRDYDATSDYKFHGSISYSVDLYDGENSCGMTTIYESDITLIERGQVWQHYFGGGCTFDSTYDEFEFHISISGADEVANPATSRYVWTPEEASQAIIDGVGDYARSRSGRLTMFRFHDRRIVNKLKLAAFNS